MTDTRLTVSLIATVMNEREALEPWLRGIEQQSRLPDEIIIVDGGSTDGTFEVLGRWHAPCTISLLRAPESSISAGRNIALTATSSDVVAITDCGTVARPDWLQKLLVAFEDPNVDVASGFFRPQAATVWERGLAAATLPDVSEVQPDRFLPSSRSVAVRSTWVKHGFLYPEWLDYCEDLVWDLQLRDAGARFTFVEDAVVSFNVRADWRSFWRQYYLYARGDGKAGLFGKRHAVRYITYACAAMVVGRRQPAEWLFAGALGLVYLRRPVKRLFYRDRQSRIPTAQTVRALLLAPMQIALGDAAKMAGYPVGVWWRWRRFRTLNPVKNWRRITPAGELWNPATPSETPPRREG